MGGSPFTVTIGPGDSLNDVATQINAIAGQLQGMAGSLDSLLPPLGNP